MKKDLVSIIVPVYNTGEQAVKLLAELVESSYRKLEIICIDDGSKDDSLVLLKEAGRQLNLKYPELKIKVLHQENQGVSAARNLGIERAEGEFLAFVDSDDLVKRNFIEELIEMMKKTKASLVWSGVEYLRMAENTESKKLYCSSLPKKTDESLRKYILRLLVTDGRLYGVTNKLFIRKIIQESDLKFDLKMNYAEDTKFVLDYLKAANGKIAGVKKPLYLYYYGTTESAAKKLTMDWKSWQKSFDNLRRWTGKDLELEEWFYLKKLYLRWRIAQILAVGRSQEKWQVKAKFLNPLLIPVATILAKIRK